jgi:type IV pilus assembly protein PilY1
MDSYDSTGQTSINAVKDLYNASLGDDWPEINGHLCQPITTKVIGIVSDDETLETTLNKMADAGDDGEVNNTTPSAYFANDVEGLLSAFREIFTEIQDSTYSGSAPLVKPAKRQGESTTVYVASFFPQNQRQWTGHLGKYVLSGDELMENPEWDAGDVLDSNTHWYDRNIYTIDWEGTSAPKLSSSNMAKFLQGSSVSLALKEEMAPMISDSDCEDFMKWVAGKDVWGETEGDERWKLSDMFHVGLTEVGPPPGNRPELAYREFSYAQKDRERRVYSHANDGMLHSFNVDDGKEEWAFIPPNILGARRLISLRYDENDRFMASASSLSRHLLDGPVVAEDVNIDGYKTIILGCLGYAGQGLYCIDVTDPEKPIFIWARENNCYNRDGSVNGGSGRTIKWQAASSGSTISVASDDSYSKLRRTVSTPFVGTVYLGDPEAPVWIAVMGGGAAKKPLQTGETGGNSVYIIDLSDGDIVKEFSDTSMNEVIAPVSILNTGLPGQSIGKFYFADNSSQIFLADCTSPVSDDWSANKIFDLYDPDTCSSKPGIRYAVELGRIGGDIWMFAGTGDEEGLLGAEADLADNYVAAINTATLSGIESPSLSSKRLDDSRYFSKLTTNADSISSSGSGWFINLGPQEFQTTPALFYKDHVFFATFLEDTDPCVIGRSRIYVMNAKTGKGVWGNSAESQPNKKYVELTGVKIGGMTISENRMYLGVTDYVFSDPDDPNNSGLPDEMSGFEKKDGLLTGLIPKEVRDSGSSTSEQLTPMYWRRWR